MSTDNECLTPAVVHGGPGGYDPDSPDDDGRCETQTRATTSVHPPKKLQGSLLQAFDSQQELLNNSALSGGYAERISLLEAAVEQLSMRYENQTEALAVELEAKAGLMERVEAIEAYLAMKAQVEAANGVQVQSGVTIN